MSAARPTTYVIKVDGHLDDHRSSLLDGLTVTRPTLEQVLLELTEAER